MNEIILKGLIRNIRYSHEINGVEYDKADIIVPRGDGNEDILSLGFKKFSNPYQEDSEIEIIGNIRSYSRKLENGKNKVNIYVFTYFDLPTEDGEDVVNSFVMDGRICKMDELRTTKSGKQNIHFVLANNIFSSDGNQINNYIPCVAWGKNALDIAKLKVSDMITVKGQLHSRTYTKTNEHGEVEIKTAHEAFILDYEIN